MDLELKQKKICYNEMKLIVKSYLFLGQSEVVLFN